MCIQHAELSDAFPPKFPWRYHVVSNSLLQGRKALRRLFGVTSTRSTNITTTDEADIFGVFCALKECSYSVLRCKHLMCLCDKNMRAITRLPW
jgi:hypothetical protein